MFLFHIASDSQEETEVKEMFRSYELRQLWKIGPPNEEGFFIITEASSKKVLIGDGNDLKVDGNFSTDLNNYFSFHVCLSMVPFRSVPSVRPSVRPSVQKKNSSFYSRITKYQ